MRLHAAPFLAGFIFAHSAAIAADKPFYGSWSCAMVADNAVNMRDLLQETYSDDGVTLGAGGKAGKLKVRQVRKNVYDLTYADGGRARLVMKEPWMFMRGTPEHSYICLRQTP